MGPLRVWIVADLFRFFKRKNLNLVKSNFFKQTKSEFTHKFQRVLIKNRKVLQEPDQHGGYFTTMMKNCPPCEPFY